MRATDKIQVLGGLFLALILQVLPTQAQTTSMRVSRSFCLDGDCLKSGWETTSNGQQITTLCTLDDCKKEGWVVYDVWDRPQREVVCKRKGCFQQGWTEYAYRTGQRLSEVTCSYQEQEDGALKQNCLKYGWRLEALNQPMQNIRCTEGDCVKKGWSVRIGRRALAEVVCMKEDCFKKGWRTFY